MTTKRESNEPNENRMNIQWGSDVRIQWESDEHPTKRQMRIQEIHLHQIYYHRWFADMAQMNLLRQMNI